jgi:prophage antirepressor-like protein
MLKPYTLKVLQELQDKQFINIIDKPEFNSLIFPGKPLTAQEFRTWVESRENGPTVSLKEAKVEWAKQRKQLQKFVKIRVHDDALRDIAGINTCIGITNQQPLNAIKLIRQLKKPLSRLSKILLL